MTWLPVVTQRGGAVTQEVQVQSNSLSAPQTDCELLGPAPNTSRTACDVFETVCRSRSTKGDRETSKQQEVSGYHGDDLNLPLKLKTTRDCLISADNYQNCHPLDLKSAPLSAELLFF